MLVNDKLNEFGLKGRAAEALEELIAGNHRFVNNVQSIEGLKQRARMSDLARDGQKPFCTLMSCSDSRVPPEIVFDRSIGEIFVVRSAGHAVNSHAVASIEYSVLVLGVPLIVVKGHSLCGAVQATLGHVKDGTAVPTKCLNELVRDLSPAVEQVVNGSKAKQLDAGSLLERAIVANVIHAANSILESSSALREKIEAGEVAIVGAFSDLETGMVRFFGLSEKEATLENIETAAV